MCGLRVNTPPMACISASVGTRSFSHRKFQQKSSANPSMVGRRPAAVRCSASMKKHPVVDAVHRCAPEPSSPATAMTLPPPITRWG